MGKDIGGYQTPRVDPLQSFRFTVKMGEGEGISGAFARFSGIRIEVETFQSRAGNENRGVKEYTPVFTNYAPVTLSKGVVGDNDFLDWVLSSCAREFSGPSGSNLRRTIEVTALDEKWEPRMAWTLQGAMPIGYELSPMDGSSSGVLTETITFAITGVKRFIPPAQVSAPTPNPPFIPPAVPPENTG